MKDIIAFKKNIHLGLILLVMTYMTVKLTCNILFFNHVYFSIFDLPLKMTYAAMLYPLVYVLMDLMAVCFGTAWTITIIFFGVLLDALFSGLILSSSFFPVPNTLSQNDLIHTQSIHNIASGIWSLYWHGLLGSIVAYLGELILFNTLYQKLFRKNFFFSSIASICTTMAIHNAICDYQMFAGSSDRWDLIISNYSVNLLVIILYTALIAFIKFQLKPHVFKEKIR